MKKTLFSTLTAVSVLAASSLSAQVAAMYSGDYVTDSITLGAASTSVADYADVTIPGPTTFTGDDALREIAFSDVTPVLAPSASYTGPAIYGGHQWLTFSATDAEVNTDILFRARDGGVNDLLQDYIQSNSGGLISAYNHVYMFQSAVSVLDSGSTWTLNIASPFGTQDDNPSAFAQADGTGTRGHWLVKDNGTYYISQVSLSHNDADLNVPHVLNGVDSTNWAVADFSGSYWNQATSTLTYNPVASFNNVEFVGFYTENDARVTNDGVGTRYDLFSVVQVPEPSTYALIFGALGLGFVFLRRRMK